MLLSTNACLQDTGKMESGSSWRYPTKGQGAVYISWNMGNSDWVLEKSFFMMRVIKHKLPEEVRESPPLDVFMTLDKALRNLI